MIIFIIGKIIERKGEFLISKLLRRKENELYRVLMWLESINLETFYCRFSVGFWRNEKTSQNRGL